MKPRCVMLMINPPIPQRFNGIVRHARARGWRLTLANRLVRAPRGWRGDGALVTLRDDPATRGVVEDLARQGVPVVDLTFYRPELDLPRCIPDYEAAGRLAARHFRDIGLRRAVWFSTTWTHVHRLFFDGFAGLWTQPRGGGGVDAPRPAKPARIVLARLVPATRLDDPDRFAAALAPRLRAFRKPTGVLTYNDEEAARVLSLCLELGIRVPEEVAILGIGNDAFLCENQPVPISSVNDDLERNGYEGARLLERLMDGAAPPPAPLRVPCRGVVTRLSTDTVAVDSPALRQALAILADRLVNPPSAAHLAEAVGVSRTTLDRLFRRELGRSARMETLRLRLARARALLEEGRAPVHAIADACGFCNPGHFVNVFKRAEGATPAAWRAAHRISTSR